MTRSLRLLFMGTLALGTLIPIQSQASTLDGSLDVEIETADRATGTIHVLTATLAQSSGAPASVSNQVIAFEIEGGPQDPDMGLPFTPVNPADKMCTTNTLGVCSVTHQATSEPSTSGTPQEITAWHEESSGTPFPDDADTMETQPVVDTDDTDAVTVSWYDGFLNLEPEAVTTPVGVQQQLTATVLEAPPTTAAAKPLLANVDVEITSGPNTNLDATKSDLECDTAQATGQCTVNYTGGTAAGPDTLRGHIDDNDNGINAPAMGAQGDEQPPAAGEADTTEGQNEGSAAGGTAEPDGTDVVTVTRSVTPSPPPPPPPPPPGGCQKIIGTPHDDKLVGTAACDRLLGRGGDDLLKGRKGDDRLIGGNGEDIARGGRGNDRCRAEMEFSC